MRTFLALAAVAFLSTRSYAQTAAKPTPAQAPQSAPRLTGFDGEWEGTLHVGEADLKLVLHLSGEKGGELRAKLDSPEQAVYGMDASSASREQDTLRFEVSTVGASYEGKLAADGKTVSGTWSQGGEKFPLVFTRRSALAGGRKPADAVSPIEGTWQGAFQNGNMRFRLQLHISHDQAKKLSGTLDSLDQGAADLPMSKISEQNGAVHFEIAMVSGVYEGTLNAAHNAITGKWSQNNDSVALEFKRSDEVLELRRPQNPMKPFPYKEEEVSFPNKGGTVTLAGTLTIPQGAGPFPAALLISGSGPQNRDEYMAGHRPFLVLADYLTRKGIAVLRYDKRGIGKSNGNFAAATTEDFAADAQSALNYMKTRKEIAPARMGAIGHSEGALIAPMLGANGSVSWIVLMAGPAQTGEKIMLSQSRAIAGAAGMPLAQVTQSLDFDKKAYELVRTEKDPEVLEKKVDAMVISSGIAEGSLPPSVAAQIHMLSSPWFRFFLDYDPVPTLQKVKCPVLALNGEKDLQVSAAENLPLIQKTLEDAGNKNTTTKPLPGLNHLFQHADSGTPTEYGAIEETISPEVMQIIGEWVGKQNLS
ncbi:MAG TPA: alpha/beta fold hydrolase [Candidatus Acidoferrum sp.]|nr:alpha/beta fold hydrolase [Candidatus Acidoferrum sp.]